MSDSKDYGENLEDIINKGLVSSVLSITHELGVFKFLADTGGPRTAGEIANGRGLKERYVQEAMNCLACANIVNVSKNSSGHVTYSLTSQQWAEFQGRHGMMLGVLASQATRFGPMVEVFKRDGPNGLEYTDDRWSQGSLEHMMSYRVKTQVELVLSQVTDIRGMLESGIQVVEFGSGAGGFLAAFAEMFPKSRFVASEYTADATAKLKSNLSYLTNTDSRQLDILNPPDDLIGQFDLALANDVIHDLPDPLGGLKTCRNVLKDEGILAMLDINGHSDVTVNKDSNHLASVFYAASAFHCVPGAYKGPGSVALGSCWGRDTAERLIAEAGLKLVSVHTHLGDAFVLFVCQK